MFDNIGGKVKKISKIVAAIGIVSCVFYGLILMATGYGSSAVGWGIIIGGSLGCYSGSCMIYAFGTLVENAQIIADAVREREVPAHAPVVVDAQKDIANDILQQEVENKNTTEKKEAAISDYQIADYWVCKACGIWNFMGSNRCKECGQHK